VTRPPVPLEQRPVRTLSGVGPRAAERLTRLGLHSLLDLLFYLPRTYVDRSHLSAISALRPLQPAVFQGHIARVETLKGKRQSLVVFLEDDSGTVPLRFYHAFALRSPLFKPGQCLRCYGEPRPGSLGLEVYHPEYQAIASVDDLHGLEDHLTPIYSLTEGLSQNSFHGWVVQALDQLAAQPLQDPLAGQPLPTVLKPLFAAVSLEDALRFAHHPPTGTPITDLLSGAAPGLRRLAVEELLAHNLAVQQSRGNRTTETAPACQVPQALVQTLEAALPFQLTAAQQRVMAEIYADLAQPRPMHRLVQGDVGAGKTLVAAMASLALLAAGFQVAVVAPTEILAEQHAERFSHWLAPLGFAVGLFLGKQGVRDRRQARTALAAGRLQVAVGTHALFEDTVQFKALGLVIIDEQHRFGVKQRLRLRDKGLAGLSPHQLTMTATPIPRTLAMTQYADLALSVIDSLPPGRQSITTLLLGQRKMDKLLERLHLQCHEGAQAYWVCTLIDESETLAAAAAEARFAFLQARLPDLRIGLIHGRLSGRDKTAIMSAFKAGDLQLLVATTVIEVGVDVPNASLMIIENPERLGLAQLHQIRGRVGRGSAKSHCVLLYGEPLSRNSQERLKLLRESQDGFYIAEQDLRLRGPGELLGTTQTGELGLRIARLDRDADWIPAIHALASSVTETSPATAQQLISRWFGQRLRYQLA
jgi:ATP-dependent DNA helicase RecG